MFNFSLRKLGNYHSIFSFIVFIHYKVTKNFANYQIFNVLYSIELTLIYSIKGHKFVGSKLFMNNLPKILYNNQMTI